MKNPDQLVAQLFEPVRERLSELSQNLDVLSGPEVLDQYVEVYMAMRAMGDVAAVMFDAMTKKLDRVERRVVKSDCDQIVKVLADRFARQVFA